MLRTRDASNFSQAEQWISDKARRNDKGRESVILGVSLDGATAAAQLR